MTRPLTYRCVTCNRRVSATEGADDELEALFHQASAKDDNGLCASCWSHWDDRGRWVAMAAWISGHWVKIRRFLPPYPAKNITLKLKASTLTALFERGLVIKRKKHWELTRLGYRALGERIARKA